jgi:Uma2 family endonuclease
MSTTKLYTIDDLLAMPDDAWYELIEGELVEVAPSAGKSSVIAANITTSISNFVRVHKSGYVSGELGGFVLRTDPDTVVAPDVGFILRSRYPDGLPDRGYFDVIPDLAVEVISPTDEPSDMRRKQRLYEQAGVPLVWWVDPRTRSVTVRRVGAEPVTLTQGDELDGEDILPGFRLAVFEIFDV